MKLTRSVLEGKILLTSFLLAICNNLCVHCNYATAIHSVSPSPSLSLLQNFAAAVFVAVSPISFSSPHPVIFIMGGSGRGIFGVKVPNCRRTYSQFFKLKLFFSITKSIVMKTVSLCLKLRPQVQLLKISWALARAFFEQLVSN